MEFVDFFTVVIAVSLGGIFGGLFGFSIILFSRLFNSGAGGYSEHPGYTAAEAFNFLLMGIVSGIVYSLLGKNLFYTMYAFTGIRYASTLFAVLFTAPVPLLHIAASWRGCCDSIYNKHGCSNPGGRLSF